MHKFLIEMNLKYSRRSRFYPPFIFGQKCEQIQQQKRAETVCFNPPLTHLLL